MNTQRRVSLLTLGCARNEVDSEELAGRLEADGWELVPETEPADVVLVNTCGFIEQAKLDSIEAILERSDNPDGTKVVAVGCMAERYGAELADQLPEAAAVLGFDHYPAMGAALNDVLAGRSPTPHQPRDRRTLLPISPAARTTTEAIVPGHGDRSLNQLGATSERIWRKRLTTGPVAPLKIASGCDRRCAFCAIPSFRGSFVSRPIADVVTEASQMAQQGVREVILVSENSTSYGKDLGDPNALPTLLRALATDTGLDRIRVSYLQPAEIRPGLLATMAHVDQVLPYFDISFQHAAGPLLRRMRRFGDARSFLDLIDEVRQLQPAAGIRSNVIVGFPGETPADVETLIDFLGRAELDAVGVFGYSDEEGTEGAELPGQVDPDEIAERVAMITELVDSMASQRAADRVGEHTRILVEDADAEYIGHTDFQGPEDGSVRWHSDQEFPMGAIVDVAIVQSDGVDLVVAPLKGQRHGSQ